MSNVLIGIIGVILFIGLALAGALFLGDEFTSTSNDAKAAAVVQQLQQLANAVSMHNLRTGSTKLSETVTASSTLVPRFLKTPPVNPVDRTGPAVLVETGGGVNNGPAATAAMLLGPGSSAGARAVCEAIQRQTGQIAAGAPFDATIRGLHVSMLTATIGCNWNGTNFYAYVRI